MAVAALIVSIASAVLAGVAVIYVRTQAGASRDLADAALVPKWEIKVSTGSVNANLHSVDLRLTLVSSMSDATGVTVEVIPDTRIRGLARTQSGPWKSTVEAPDLSVGDAFVFAVRFVDDGDDLPSVLRVRAVVRSKPTRIAVPFDPPRVVFVAVT